MKKILIPFALIILVLFIVAMILGRSNRTASNQDYHVHEDGSTHYSAEIESTYHVHDDGVTHYDEH